MLLCLGVVAISGTSCHQSDAEVTPIEVSEVWSRPAKASPAMVQSGGQTVGHGKGGTGAVFLEIVNRGEETDRLVSASSDVADVVEIHETTIVDEVMIMRRIAHIDLLPSTPVVLKPGSYHIMLIGLHRDLSVGDRLYMELSFEKSPPLTIEAEVREP
jgi:copper(I)-binding protein